MFKDETGEIVPSIVSEELWEAANVILRRRSEDVKNRQGICNHANLLTGKLFCTHCGAPYYRRESKDKAGNKNSKWVCSGKINNGADSCPSFPIYEEEIKPLLLEVFRETETDSTALIEEYIKMYRQLSMDGGLEKELDRVRQKADAAEAKKSKLLQLSATGRLSDDDFFKMNDACNAELSAAQCELLELQSQRESSEDYKKHIEAIRTVLKAAELDAAQGLISKEFVDKYIDKIFVTPESDGSMRLEIKIFTGESTEKLLQKLKRQSTQKPIEPLIIQQNSVPDGKAVLAGRTGHTSKKMIEAYENGMK